MNPKYPDFNEVQTDSENKLGTQEDWSHHQNGKHCMHGKNKLTSENKNNI